MPPTVNMGIPGTTSAVVAPPTGRRVLLAEPRGYCAGVDRAVETVERALEKHGAPVYVLRAGDRLVVVGAPDAEAPHHHHHGEVHG